VLLLYLATIKSHLFTQMLYTTCILLHCQTSINQSLHDFFKLVDLQFIFMVYAVVVWLPKSCSVGLPNGLLELLVTTQFLANVNSRSRSLYAIARPSVVCCNFRAAYSAGWNFRQCFYVIWYLGHPLTSTENFTDIVPGEPLRRGSGWGKRKRGSQI